METFEFSVQKYIRNIFPHGPKSLLTSVINYNCVRLHFSLIYLLDRSTKEKPCLNSITILVTSLSISLDLCFVSLFFPEYQSKWRRVTEGNSYVPCPSFPPEPKPYAKGLFLPRGQCQTLGRITQKLTWKTILISHHQIWVAPCYLC